MTAGSKPFHVMKPRPPMRPRPRRAARFRVTPWRLLVIGVLACGLSLAGLLHHYMARANAEVCADNGIACGYGYFTGQGKVTEGLDMFAPEGSGVMGANNLNDLFGRIGGSMLCKNAGQPGSVFGVPQNDHNATGAAFIVLTMLGERPGTYKNRACERWTEWTDLMGEYDKAGLIHWNEAYNYCVNTLYSTQYSDAIYYTECSVKQSIVFYSPSGQRLYAIKRDCGNPLGRLQALPPLNHPPTGTANPPTPPKGPESPPGFTKGNSSQSSCTDITGRAFDQDTPNTGPQVVIRFSNGDSASGRANPGNQTFDVPTPPSVSDSLYPVTVTGDVIDTTTGQPVPLQGTPFSIGPCLIPHPSCAGADIPGTIDPGAGYQITGRVQYGNSREANAVRNEAGAKFYIIVQGPGGPGVNQRYDVPIGINNSVLNGTKSYQATGQTGVYSIGWGVDAPVGGWACGTTAKPPTNPPTFSVVNRPYFEVDGGDASAGAGKAGAGSGCGGSNPDAGIVSWNRGAAGNFGGAGASYGAYVLKHLQDFASGLGSASVPSGLSFANNAQGQVDDTAGRFGGNFGNVGCQPDYFANAPTASGGNVEVYGGDYRPGAMTIPDGKRLTVYVDGDAYIGGNITFDGSYGDISKIPSFTLVVRGNIYIAPNVTQLDGFYIAQPSDVSAKGIIYTCAPNGSPAGLNRGLQNACDQPLTVDGAFTARQVWLLRSNGTISTTPAERFVFSPELWASLPPFGATDGAAGDNYDAITSLPPVL